MTCVYQVFNLLPLLHSIHCDYVLALIMNHEYSFKNDQILTQVTVCVRYLSS